ncbi:hypothetical protein M2444_004714 [Paenibacillus sp. PastF-3]|nr:hypothetical protein [Paenibacillus sp. PastF-3]
MNIAFLLFVYFTVKDNFSELSLSFILHNSVLLKLEIKPFEPLVMLQI